MKIYKYSDEQFTQIVKESYSITDVIRKLGLKVAGSNYDTVKRKIKQLNLDTSHFTGQKWNKGKKVTCNPGRSLEDILVEHSTYVSTFHLKEKILKYGYKKAQCECCGLTEWQGYPIALELHHINGIKDDLRIENLQILCPNCHAMTDNYRGKNINSD